MSRIPDEDLNKKQLKKYSFEEAKLKAASFCAYQERYQQEVRDKLYTYGLKNQEVEQLLSYLIVEGFVNEERFAKAFAGGRFRLKKWGKNRIKFELTKRKISPYCIEKGLEEIGKQEYLETLNLLIEKKARNIGIKNPKSFKKTIADHLIRKGFENELVWDILNDKFSIGFSNWI